MQMQMQQQTQQTTTNSEEEEQKKLTETKWKEYNYRKKLFRPRNWIIPGIFVFLTLFYTLEDWKEQVKLDRQVSVSSGSGPKQTLAQGKATVGGSFTLVDTDGRAITDSEFRGKWMLMYFGFTHCPDICPEEMKKMSSALDMLPRAISQKVQPVFISCDPRRDSCDAVRDYLKDFHPRFVGLTGTPDQVKNACKKFRVYYTTPDYEEGKEDYLVDHSVFIYLMDPYGYFNGYFSRQLSAEEIASQITQGVKQFDKEMEERRKQRQKEQQQ